MSTPILPRYPIYIPSKGRYDTAHTVKFLLEDGVPFYLVVEPQEYDAYASRFGESRVLCLPFSNPGSVIPARNWIKEHATAAGHLRHWQLDDNIKAIERYYRNRRLRCSSGVALATSEDFVDRYENIAVAGLNYTMFVFPGSATPPLYRNARVYSCSLILNSLPHQWRGRYNEDTDLCLQVLADGWCTVLINTFLIRKIWTMQVKGGNTATLYQGDGRLRMARALERLWPHVVYTDRRFQRPQHVVRDQWKMFDTPFRLKPGIDLSQMGVNEYGMELVEVKPVQNKDLQKLQVDYSSHHPNHLMPTGDA